MHFVVCTTELFSSHIVAHRQKFCWACWGKVIPAGWLTIYLLEVVVRGFATSCMQFCPDCRWSCGRGQRIQVEKDEDRGLHLHNYREAVILGGCRLSTVAALQSPVFLPIPLTSCFVSKPNKPIDSLGDCWPNHTSVCHFWQLRRRVGHCFCLSRGRDSSNRGSCRLESKRRFLGLGLAPTPSCPSWSSSVFLAADLRALMRIAFALDLELSSVLCFLGRE